jgi:hypothetical protein
MTRLFNLGGDRYVRLVGPVGSDVNVANVKDGCCNPKQIKLLLWGETNNIKSSLYNDENKLYQRRMSAYFKCPPFFTIVNAVHVTSRLVQVVIILDITVQQQGA